MTKRLLSMLLACVVILALTIPTMPAAAVTTTAANDRLALRFNQPFTMADQTEAMEITRQWAVEDRPWVDPVAQQQTTAKWTVLVFIGADNNLEAAALADINEMEYVGSSPDVNVVIEVDRSEDYADDDGDWTEGRRYYIQQDRDLEAINSPVLENMGEINSGDPKTVSDFVVWGIQNYPAEKYMLVLWDHGGGWIANLTDDDSGDDLDLLEVGQILQRAQTEAGIDKFELLAFDMCLMGQFEVAATIAPYAKYGLASEEVVPGPGYFYVFVDELIKNPDMDGAELSGHVIDYFMQFYEEWGKADAYGLSAYDLSQIGAVETAVNDFSKVVQANPAAALSSIADARNNTISFGGFDDPQYYDVWSSVDVYKFGELLGGLSTLPNIQAAAQALTQAVSGFVLHDSHNDALEGSHGLAIYFPRNYKAYKTASFNTRYPAEMPPMMADWINFINVFHGTATETVTTAPTVTVTSAYPEVASIYQPAVVTLDVSGRDIVQVNFAVSLIVNDSERTVLDFDYLISRTTTATGADIVNWSDGVTSRSFTWEAEVPLLTDGTNSTYALLIPNRDDPNVAIVNGQYQSVRGGDPIDAQLVFDLNTRQMTAIWGINETQSGALQPFELTVEAGDTFTPLWLMLDADNQLAGSRLSDTALQLAGTTPISFEKVPAPSGQYSISFVAENVAGETTLAESIIQVSNDGLDPAQRGYTDLTYGVNFRYPANWVRPRFLPDGKRLFTGLETGDLNTTTAMTLFPYTDVASAQETAQKIKDSWAELEGLAVSDEREVEINGLPAYVIDYTYTIAGMQRVGAVIAIYVPDQMVGYGFDIDAPAGDPAEAQKALQILIESINFFPVQQAAELSGWQTVSLVDGLVSFQVPAGWTSDAAEGWTTYGPVDDPNIFVGLAAEAASGQSKEELAQFWVSQLQAQPGFTLLAEQPYYVGNQEWYLVVFTYDKDVKIGGAFFVTSVGGNDYVFWLEAPDASFDQIYNDVFSVVIDGVTFNG